ncbi:uncharacterized protein AMSG_02922 [Thecamonas trahens ATCC 50062]|uniref:Uncharacterized protein n=1 Tax=Thecamonas trahens ATCC 50062 TaxID=461836 RepID=A0A0L0D2G2_THETB|nr:hypothetical protein AMSG_02922 [Thecamonas trahens ATCC 50062]KNC46487.1 hypothetical protein AMSG_02922 [Thecamonas trahens ATCC 50062]|eukprot:XP_013760268.1 hypothetical protein AMSG_02922 [Thecamonas trahens ATCC 50062]
MASKSEVDRACSDLNVGALEVLAETPDGAKLLRTARLTTGGDGAGDAGGENLTVVHLLVASACTLLQSAGESGDVVGRLAAALQVVTTAAGVSIDTGSEPSAWTPLHFACMMGAGADVIGVLVASGADVCARDAKGNTPLHHAAAVAQARTVHALLAAGADGRAVNRAMQSPIEYATQALKEDGAWEAAHVEMQRIGILLDQAMHSRAMDSITSLTETGRRTTPGSMADSMIGGKKLGAVSRPPALMAAAVLMFQAARHFAHATVHAVALKVLVWETMTPFLDQTLRSAASVGTSTHPRDLSWPAVILRGLGLDASAGLADSGRLADSIADGTLALAVVPSVFSGVVTCAVFPVMSLFSPTFGVVSGDRRPLYAGLAVLHLGVGALLRPLQFAFAHAALGLSATPGLLAMERVTAALCATRDVALTQPSLLFEGLLPQVGSTVVQLWTSIRMQESKTSTEVLKRSLVWEMCKVVAGSVASSALMAVAGYMFGAAVAGTPISFLTAVRTLWVQSGAIGFLRPMVTYFLHNAVAMVGDYAMVTSVRSVAALVAAGPL